MMGVLKSWKFQVFAALTGILLFSAGVWQMTSSPVVSFSVFVLIFLVTSWVFAQKIKSRFVAPVRLATLYIRGVLKGHPPQQLPPSVGPEVAEFIASVNKLGGVLHEKSEMIVSLEKLRIEFVSNVSHELRTPLTSIKGYTETLINGALRDPETAAKFVSRIDENAARLQALISDLLDLSSLETYPKLREWAVFEGHQLKSKLEQTFEPLLIQRNQTLQITFQDTRLEGDLPKLEQIFTNLIENAIKYCGRGTRIEVSEHADKGRFYFSVRDNGPGIDAEHLPRLFERFYRVDPARNRETGGTGLGLAIVKHSVVAHGGQIEVESELNKGTVFKFWIPKSQL